MPEQVDTRVTLSMHPETVRALDGYTDETAPFVAEVESAFRDAYVTIGKIHDATAMGKTNGVWTEAQRILAVGKVAEKEQDRLFRKFDRVAADLGRAIAFTEGELSKPLKERSGLGNLNGEVRAHAKALDRSERAAMLEDAFEQRDLDTLQAVLGAQPFLSGLSRPEHDHYLRRFHGHENPALVARLTVMRSAMVKLDRDAGLLFGQVEQAVGAPPKTVRAIDAANDRAVAALNIGASA